MSANVPLIGEGFRKRTNMAGDPAAITSWVGPSSPLRLSIADGSTAYGHVEAVADITVGAAVVGYLPAFTLITGHFTIEAQVRIPDGSAQHVGIGVSTGNNPTTLGIARQDTAFIPAGGDWHLVSVDFYTPEPSYPAAAAAGLMFLYVTQAPLAYDVSYLGFFQVAGSIPTRVYPRADGLGMGAPRIMDGRSPYTSPRVFGMI